MYHIYVYEYNQFFKILNFDNLIIQKKINVNIILLKIFFCLLSFNLTTLNLLEIYSYVRFLMHFIKAFVIFSSVIFERLAMLSSPAGAASQLPS